MSGRYFDYAISSGHSVQNPSGFTSDLDGRARTSIIHRDTGITHTEMCALNHERYRLSLMYGIGCTQHVLAQYLSGRDPVAQNLSNDLLRIGDAGCLRNLSGLADKIILLHRMSCG